jgi:hypothetical protein
VPSPSDSSSRRRGTWSGGASEGVAATRSDQGRGTAFWVGRVARAVAAISIGCSWLVASAGAARGASPIDGVYRITETFPTGQGVTAPACWATPKRAALSTDPATLKTVFYDVQITVVGDRVVFSKPGVSATLFSAPIKADPVVSGQLPTYHVQDSKLINNPTSGNDYWYVDGRFLVHPGGTTDVDLVWQFQDSPDLSGLCRTEINGSQTSGGTTLPGGSSGGIPVEVVIAVVGGVVVVTTITIGGWRWRNRKGPLTPPGDRLGPKVPGRCRSIAERYDSELEILHSLREAATELHEKLDRAETIHKNNLIKARMVINLEIIQTVGGLATDFALALRPAVLRKALPGVLGEQDTWTPPGSINPGLANQIAKAEELWRDLLGRFHRLGNEIEMLKGTVAQAVENLPGVKNAKQLWEFHMNRLGEMIADLPGADALRSQIANLGSDIDAARGVADQTEAAWRAASDDFAHTPAQGALKIAQNQMPQAYWDAAGNLKKAQDHLLDLLQDSRALDPDHTLVTSAQAAVTQAQATLAAVEGASPAQLAAIRDVQKVLDAKAQGVKDLWAAHLAAGKTYDDLVSRRQTLSNTLTFQYNDLKAADITNQGRIAGQAEREWQQAIAQGRQQVGMDLAAKEAERERVFNEAYAAHELVNELRAKAERGGPTWNQQVGSALGSAVGFVLKPITIPVGVALEVWEWAFGASQSPQEIVNFLVRGQAVVVKLREYSTTLDKRTFEQEQLVERLRTQVQACVDGVTVPGIPAPTAAPVGSAVATPGPR